MTNDYKWLRILEKFLRSYVYEWRGTLMLCPKSPHRLCHRRRRCRQAVGAVTAVKLLSLNVNIQKLKSVSHVPRGTSAMQLLHV